MLDEIRSFCAALYQHKNQKKETYFRIWRNYWIASNGKIGRKKTVTATALNGVVGEEDESDPYAFLFAVETAIVFLARELSRAAGNNVRSNPASGVFEWWEDNPTRSLAVIAESLRVEITQRNRSAFLSALAEDQLRQVYHALIPKAIRHTLGAYLSPPDLCDYVIEGVGADEVFRSNDKRLLEPNCGLGAFFSALLAKGLRETEAGNLTTAKLGTAFRNQIFGIEKNLGSYVVSRYLHQGICALLCDGNSDCENVVWGDSVFVDEGLIAQKCANLLFSDRTLTAGLLRIQINDNPTSANAIQKSGNVIAFFDDVDWHDSQVSVRSWLEACADSQAAELHQLALTEVVRLETLGYFAFIVGNPPWVNWENLDPAYKKLILPSWPPLGLFAMSGRDRAFSKEDLSVLATYAACLRFGSPTTKVGLLLPQGLFQSRKNSKGFRRFQLGQAGMYLKVDGVTDFSSYSAFGDAKNRTAAFFCTLSPEPTAYPVRYLRFVPSRTSDGSQGAYTRLWAAPSTKSDSTSNWALYDHLEEIRTSKTGGETYRARTGVFTGGANAIYYVRVLGDEGNCALLENETERAKIKVEQQKFLAEFEFIYPFAKGRDISQWSVKRPMEQGIILPHTAETRIKPVAPGVLTAKAPRTLAYLSQHEKMLSTRASLTALDRANVAEGFYALLRVGEYTFAPYKVAWRYISKVFCCAVIDPSNIVGADKPTILQEKLISIAFASEDEAHYVCAYLSATKIKREIERRIVGTQVSVHVIEDIHIPKFDAANLTHKKMAALCKDGHSSDGLTASRLSLLDALVGELEAYEEANSLALPASTSEPPLATAESQATTSTP
jgi:hypothetical protein